MTRGFEGSAEVLARLYFQDILAWLRELFAGTQAIASAFSSLKEELNTMVPRSCLRLYPRCRPEYGPTSIEWGELVDLRSANEKARNIYRPRVIRDLPGTFKDDWAFTIAKRRDLLASFQSFDRRAQALNRAFRAILRAIRHLKTSTTVRFKVEASPAVVPSGLIPETFRELPPFPAECEAPDLPAMYRPFLRSAWVAAFSLGLAEEELSVVAREVSANPSAAGIGLELGDRTESSYRRRAYWIHEATGNNYPKLTHLRMKMLRIKEAVRPVLTQKELKRARIARNLSKTAKGIDLLRKRCAVAQLAVSTGLAEALLLPEALPQGLSQARAAG
jgi:hypothetical protein